jgi:hypothetical protein
MVPDHWAPIALLARQRGWSPAETAQAALRAGMGHVVTTLLFGVAVWLIGAAAAERFGAVVDGLASLALIGFGGWIAVGAWREMQAESDGASGHGHAHHHHHDRPLDHEEHDHDRTHAHHGDDGHLDHDAAPTWARDPLYAPAQGVEVVERHRHWHRHGDGPAHFHWHDHGAATAHFADSDMALDLPLHMHRHRTTGRTAMLLLLGSSPMVEGIPAFFAASRYSFGLMAAMAVLFAASTIGTYVVLSVSSVSGLRRLDLGPFERYGEVISGVLMALIGIGFGVFTFFS